MYNKTSLEAFYDREKKHPKLPFLHQPFGEKWETYSWGETGKMARQVAAYLRSLDLKPGSHIGLVSKNCREWIIADLAIMMAGHVSVPFFATLTGEQIGQVIELGDIDLLIAGKMEGWADMKTGVPEEMPMIHFPHYEGNSDIMRGKAWRDILAEFEPIRDSPLPDPAGLWTIIFTSGTTGTPKGVMLTNQVLIELMDKLWKPNPLRLDYNGGNRFFSFLPLNHVAERGVIETMCLTHGGEIFFTESIARFAANLQDARPTFFFAVPRIWTKLRLGVLSKMPAKRLNRLLSIPIVSTVVKRKIRSGLGLDKSRCNVSGAAPIPSETKEWFGRLGIPISEAYGMTENGATSHMITATENRPGSVGRPQNGTEHRIDPETEEVLTRSPYTMKGYYNSPDKTAETIDKDGWLHTGDQGRIDADDYLYLTGRVKDTFKTAKAKFIVPTEIEEKFIGNDDVEQMCLLGLGMPQPILLVSLSEIGSRRPHEAVVGGLRKQLTVVNEKLASYKKVAAIVILKEPFSVENNLMTPTLKVKRAKVHSQYKDRMLDWVESGRAIIEET